MSRVRTKSELLNELLSECFSLNRTLLAASQVLTEGSGITGAQWGVLTAFSYAGTRVNVAETARTMGLTRQSVQRVADVLESLHLIEYMPDETDKRSRSVRITSEGQKLLIGLEERQRAWIKQIMPKCGAAEIEHSLGLLKLVHARMSDDD